MIFKLSETSPRMQKSRPAKPDGFQSERKAIAYL